VKEKRFHCPACAEEGIVRKFSTNGALEMHKSTVHPPARPTLAPISPARVTTTREEQLRKAGEFNAAYHVTKNAGKRRSVLWPIGFLALAAATVALVIYSGTIREEWGYWLAGDPTATHQ